MAVWTRVETDELGSCDLPGEALYGINTQRASENFPVSGLRIEMLSPLLRGMAQIKKAAALANLRLGKLSEVKAEIICRTCDEIISGQHKAHFIVDALQGGGGTSSHMNMNEVIANRGLELLGFACGDYHHLDPIRDVNMSQSTTEVHATALRLALLQEAPLLAGILTQLSDSFEQKGHSFTGILKFARTHLQDATPMTLREEFVAFAAALRAEVAQIAPVAARLTQVNIGGNIVGTEIARQPDFAAAILHELSALTELPLTLAQDTVSAAWNNADLLQFSALLRGIAMLLSKIANDLRLLSSGPQAGFGEITLPSVQAGSAVIAGKVNPVIPEMVNQMAFKVAGSDVAVTMAVEAGQLQRNVFDPLIAHSLLSSMNMLGNAARLFAERCVDGIRVNPEKCHAPFHRKDQLFAGLVPLYGAEAAQEIVDALAAGKDLAQLLLPPKP